MEYSKLFEPFEIKNKHILKNRIVMAPMTTISGNDDGSFSDAEIAYLVRRAKAGIGMIMTPACYCHKSGHAFARQVGCHKDEMLPSLSRCAEAINNAGAMSVLQIHHGGNAAKSEYTGQPPLAPSAVRNRSGNSEMSKEMTEDEILLIIESFGAAAGRAKKAGFSGLEIHGANTYLFQQFFSPYTNKRTDRWGVDRFENRSRFAVEVVKAVRGEVGESYPIFYRISPEEVDPDGYSVYDAIELIKSLIPLGVDIVHVSSWDYVKGARDDVPAGSNPTKIVREALPPEIPVIGVGGIIKPEQAMKVLNDGVELVALGKILLLEPDWALKVSSGQSDRIKTSISVEEERNELELPGPMREYTKRFITVL